MKTILLMFAVTLILAVSVFLGYLKVYKDKQLSANFAAMKYLPNEESYKFTFTLKDDFITNPIPINNKKGKLLATVKLSVRAYYVKPDGKESSVIVPLIIQKLNGETIFFGSQKVTTYSDKTMSESIEWFVNEAKWYKGNHKYTRITKDVSSTYLKDDTLPAKEILYDVIEGYEKGREKEIQNFVEKGDPKIDLLIPVFVDSSNQ